MLECHQTKLYSGARTGPSHGLGSSESLTGAAAGWRFVPPSTPEILACIAADKVQLNWLASPCKAMAVYCVGQGPNTVGKGDLHGQRPPYCRAARNSILRLRFRPSSVALLATG